MKVCPVCKLERVDGTHCPRDGTPLVAKRNKDPLEGRTLKGRWLLEARVGEGGMGLVYRCRDVRTDGVAAVKILQYRTDDEGREHAARFAHETELLYRLQHPNIVQYLDSGSERDLSFMVMEFLTGKTLQEAVPRGGLAYETAVDVLEEVCAALETAHKQLVIHRDMKPDNVFIAAQPDGSAVVKVIDFGLAKALETDESAALTMTGKVVGSAGFIAPEHILGGRQFTPQSDVYALGGILFYMLTGRKPYHGQGVAQIMQAQVAERPPQLGLPEGHRSLLLEPVVRRAMSRSVEKRYATVADFLAAVHAAVRPTHLSSSTTVVLGGVTVVKQVVTGVPARSNREPALALLAGMATGMVLLAGLYFLLR